MSINIGKLIGWENKLFETLFALRNGNIPPQVDLSLMEVDSRVRYLRFTQLVRQGSLAPDSVRVGLIGTLVMEMGRAFEGAKPRNLNPFLTQVARQVDPAFRPNKNNLRELERGLDAYSDAIGGMLKQQSLFNYDEVVRQGGVELATRALRETHGPSSSNLSDLKRLNWGRFVNDGATAWVAMMGEAEVPVLERVSQRRLFPRLFAGVLGSAFLFCVGNFLYGIYQHKKSDELATNFIFDLGDSIAKTPAQMALVTGARYLMS